MSTDHGPLASFRESQPMIGPALRLVVVFGIAFTVALGLYVILSSGQRAPGQFMPILMGVLMASLFLGIRLDVEVGDRELRIHVKPMGGRVVTLAEVRDVREVARAHWYSLRHGFGHGTGRQAFLMGGDDAVELTLADGKRLLVGTRRPSELRSAIEGRMAAR
jgi:hypothetical protein